MPSSSIDREQFRVLAQWAEEYTESRSFDVVVGHLAGRPPHIQRWHIIPRNDSHNVYLHRFLDSDHDLDCHDHPYDTKALLLTGTYLEWIRGNSEPIRYSAGDTIIRPAAQAHRIDLINGPCLTLFFTGPRVYDWGWYHSSGWIQWPEYIRRREEGTL